ncbi:hypothetical protein RCOM_1611990 [Ricinus communis]|uniref:Uncharacterized protein n=1 Tax=Ricinus communis TaxID=3988 RepID=B9RDC4_RICCO|nr:hypothetical protein RCOM_1611990 [Ricinus communis]
MLRPKRSVRSRYSSNIQALLTGIKPNDEFYELSSIEKAIKEATGCTPAIECNMGGSGNSHLFQVFLVCGHFWVGDQCYQGLCVSGPIS